MKVRARKCEGGRLSFFCPGCEDHHVITIEGAYAWGFNGDYSRPTITPSILVEYVKAPPEPWPVDESGKYKLGPDGRIEGAKDMRCHSFVTDGRIRFLDDCTHELAGKEVELPEDEK